MNMPSASAPKPFIRMVTTPPGLPWNQTRMALLEARHTSPVSGALGDDLHIVIRRLEGWRPNLSGSFVAIYLRGSDLHSGVSFQVEARGRVFPIDLPPKGDGQAILKEQLSVYGAGLLVVLALAFAIGLSWQRRQEADFSISAVETRLGREYRQASSIVQAKRDAVALTEQGLKGRALADAMKDLRIVSIGRNPEARIDAFVWRDGDWGLEVYGDAVPMMLEGVDMRRDDKPVRRGVWLWQAQPDALSDMSVARSPVITEGAPDGL